MVVPYPPDTRAKGWRFELDLEQIGQSDTWVLAPPDIRPWLLMLWSVSWQQTPCGSLPGEDAIIAARIGMKPAAFAKHKAVLLRGWEPADDGRLYHQTITQRVLAMLEVKQKEKDRKAAYRARMSATVPRDNHGTDPGCDATGTGTGTGTGLKPKTGVNPESGGNTPREEIHQPPPVAAAPPAQNRTQIDPDFKPDEPNRRVAVSHDLDVESERGRFIAHFTATGDWRANWQAQFRKWILDSMQHRAESAKRQGAPPGPRRNRHDERSETIAALTGRRNHEQHESGNVIDITPTAVADAVG